MQILTTAFGAALLLIIVLLSEIACSHRLRRAPAALSPALQPIGIPFFSILALMLFVPIQSANFSPEAGLAGRWLLQLSAALPVSTPILTALSLAVLGLLYRAVERMFGYMEFPDSQSHKEDE
jgi:hypothetical protein